MKMDSKIKLFFSLLAVMTGMFSWIGLSIGSESSSQVSNVKLKASSLLPTVDIPNAPSLARLATDHSQKVTPESWEDPAICGGCHTTQYQGWKGSMHSNSFKDPLFQAEWALAEKELGGNIGNLCGGCHSPVGMLTNTIKFDPSLGKHGGFTAPPIAENGVFCDVCHTISGSTFSKSSVMEHGNGSYQSSPGPVKRGPIKDAKSPYHETAHSEQHTQAAFCGNCHNIFNPLNQFPLERTYDEWKYSVYAQNGVQCQDCHMVPVETAMRVADTLTPAAKLKDHGLGGKAGIGAEQDREIVHGHGFVGGNAVITAVLGDPDSRRHAGIAVKRLRNVADVDVSLSQVPGQGSMGSMVHLAVKVTNRRAGHDLPTSLTFVRELWVDVTVTDQSGRVLLRSGALDEHDEVDPNATMFKNYAVDKHGKPAQYIWTVERFERRNTIPPKGHHISNYYFNANNDVKQLIVRTKLNYRSASQHFVDHLLGDSKVKVPVITMNDIETVYSLPSMKVASVTDHNKLSDADKEAERLLEDYNAPDVVVKKTGLLVQACAACHGQDGIGTNKLIPNLAGQKEKYLLSALRAYKSGTRKDSRMNAMLKDVGDDQLSELATHYSKINKPNKN